MTGSAASEHTPHPVEMRHLLFGLTVKRHTKVKGALRAPALFRWIA